MEFHSQHALLSRSAGLLRFAFIRKLMVSRRSLGDVCFLDACVSVCVFQITELKILLIVSGRAGAVRSLAARGNRKGNVFWTQGPDFSISASASAAFCEIREALEWRGQKMQTERLQGFVGDAHRRFTEEGTSMLGIY